MIDIIKRELLIAVVLLAIGLAALPAAIYFVGQQIMGPYESEAGLTGLMDQIWADLMTGAPHAWLLVLSPWLVIQTARLAMRAGRRRKTREPDHSSAT
jgi:hypothetical protein